MGISRVHPLLQHVSSVCWRPSHQAASDNTSKAPRNHPGYFLPTRKGEQNCFFRFISLLTDQVHPNMSHPLPSQ
jgi:hypothetical protein